MTLLKVLALDGTSYYGGKGRWTPGRWRSVRGPLVPCQHGLHLVTLDQLPPWLGPAIWEAEAAGERIDQLDKVVARRARIVRRLSWDKLMAANFAAECADRAIHIHAVAALRTAGLIAEADRLAATATIVDKDTARAAAAVALGIALSYTVQKYNLRGIVMDAAAAASDALDAFQVAAHEAAFYASAAFYARAAAGGHAIAERAWQARRLGELLGIGG